MTIMTETPVFLASRLHSEGLKTYDFFLTLAPEEWSTAVYAGNGKWCIRDLLAHFIATEQAFHLLIANILEDGKGAPQEFDLDSYNEAQINRFREASISELLDTFLQERQKTVQIVQSLSFKDLERRGRHPFLGEAELADIIRLVYRHHQIHQRDIRKVLASL